MFGSPGTGGPTWLIHPDREFVATPYVEDSLRARLNTALNDDCNPPIVNDTSITLDEGDSIVVTINNQDGDLPNDITNLTLLSNPQTGSATVNSANSQFTYKHNDNESFTDQFKVVVADRLGLKDTFTVNATIAPVNDNAPVSVKDSVINISEGAKFDSPVSILNNDTDVDVNNTLTAKLDVDVLYGSLTLNSDGTFSYTHNGSENFSDSFEYHAFDGVHDGNTVKVTIKINPVNDNAPVAIKDSIIVDEGGTVGTLFSGSANVLDNDTDIDGGTLTAKLVTNVTNGSLTFNDNGTFSYIHNGSENFADFFEYSAFDGDNDGNTVKVSIHINSVNDNTPVSVMDSIYANKGAAISQLVTGETSVLNNDSDIDGMDSVTVTLVTNVSNGTLTLNSNGTFLYTHDGSANYLDSFTYQASDGTHTGNTVIVSICINPLNDYAPVSVKDSANVAHGGTINTLVNGNLSVLDNDTDQDGMSGVTAILVNDVKNGSLSLNSDGSFSYVHNGSATVLDTFTYKTYDGMHEGNTAPVIISIKEEVDIVNNLEVLGFYDLSKKNDTVTITIDSINSLSSIYDSIVTIKVSKQPGMDPILFDTNISVSELLAVGNSSSFNIGEIDEIPILQSTMYITWDVTGKSGKMSVEKNSSFKYGWNRPVYSGELSATSTSNGAELTFTYTDPVETVDSVRVLWDLDSLPWTFTTNLPEQQIHYLNPITKLTDTLNGLSSNTEYYLGIQIFKDGFWSALAANSTVKAKTAIGDTSTVSNTISITNATFLKTLNSINVNWSIPDISVDSGKYLEYGWSVSISDSEAIATTPKLWNKVSDLNSTDTVSLGDNLLFDTTYTVAYWLRLVDSINGPGKPAAPTSASKIEVLTPGFTWIPIEIDFSTTDTISLFNGDITFVNISGESFSFHDTIVNVIIPDSLCKSFVKGQGISFKFKNGEADIPPILLRMRSSIDSTYNPSIFCNNECEFNAIYNSEERAFTSRNGFVEKIINSSMLKSTFVVLGDTIPALVNELSSENDYLNSGESINMKIAVSDNISNIKWTLNAGTGKGKYSYSTNGYLDSLEDSIVISIPSTATLTSEAYGTKVLLIVEDGTFTDTLNLSRRVNTPTSDIYTVPEKRWIPLRATSELIDQSLRGVINQTTGSDSYNKDLIRIARWYDPIGTGKPDIIEYSDALKNDFILTPGKVVWMKSLNSSTVNLGAGITNSLRTNTTVTLKANSWNDIAIPYKFDVKLSDIIDKTDNGNVLTFYKWRSNGNTYNAHPVYIPALDSLGTILDTAVMNYSPSNDAWVIYNPLPTDINMVIPPLSADDNRLVTRSKTESLMDVISINWNEITDGNAGAVRVGFSDDKSYVSRGPIPPNFGKITASVSDETGVSSGYLIKCGASEGGAWYRLKFKSRDISNKKIIYNINNISSKNKTLNVFVFNPNIGDYISADSDTITLSKNKLTEERIIVIGTSEYISGYKEKIFINSFALNQVFPNPFKGIFNLKFTVPWNNIDRLSIRLMDIRGRTIYSKEIRERFMPGERNVRLNMQSSSGMQLSSGVYILMVSAVEPGGKVSRFERKLTCIK